MFPASKHSHDQNVTQIQRRFSGRVVRSVGETGIQAMRWAREEAIDYMLANTGMTESDVVLTNGSMPLNILEELVLQYIADEKANE